MAGRRIRPGSPEHRYRQPSLNMALVYSTETGRTCPECNQPLAECQCRAQANALVKGDGVVRVSRESKGRSGKGVTLVTGLPLTSDELKKLAKKLKQICGTGGTVKDGVIEIQGEQRDRLVTELNKLGYKAKKAGG